MIERRKQLPFYIAVTFLGYALIAGLVMGLVQNPGSIVIGETITEVVSMIF